MKLLYITVSMPFGHGEAFFIAEVHEMRRQGCEVLIVPRSPSGECVNHDTAGLDQISLRKPIIDADILAAAVCVFVRHPIRCLRTLALFFHSRNLATFVKNLTVFPKSLWIAKLAKQRGTDHIHAQWALTTATMAMAASEITGIPWSCTAHRGDIADDNMLAVKTDRATFFRFISESGVKLAQSRGVHADAQNIHVLHMGVILPPAEQVCAPPKNVVRLLCPANLVPVKGHRYLLEAIRLLKQRGVECHLDVAGGGPLLDELQATVKALDIEDRTQFVGIIPHDQLLKLYRNGEVGIVVLPSVDLSNGLHEGIPVCLIEAMAHGVPVVSTTTGGIPELLRDGAGVLVSPKDSAALADAIERLLGDENLRNQISEAGHRRVEQEYGVESVVSALLGHISKSISSYTRQRLC